jgi:alpha-glucosidase
MNTSSPPPPIDFTVARPSEHVLAIRFGNPIEYGAMPTLKGFFTPGVLPEGLHVSRFQDKLQLVWDVEAGSRMLGLGSLAGTLDRRGRKLQLYPRQTAPQVDGTTTSNGSHPFLIIRESERHLGIFINSPSRVQLDVAHAFGDKVMALVSPDSEVVLFAGNSVNDLVTKYFSVLKDFWIPPRWAFGYHQCRYSYESVGEVRRLAHKFKELDVPCDALYLDIHYMDRYKVFSASPEHFEGLDDLVKECAELGIKIVPILDPGIRVEQDYEIWSEGTENGFFCKDAEGNPFETVVWPGRVHLPDFVSNSVRVWWAEKVKAFTEKYGVQGYWLDMNEPETFVHPERFLMYCEHFAKLNETDYTADELFGLWEEVRALFNDEREHDFFFHQQTPRSKPLAHALVHSLYCLEMCRATRAGVSEDFFLISRGSVPGTQRFAGTWTGDNSSSWYHLGLHVSQMLSLNLSGQLYCGADVGGHIGDVSHELLIRWMQVGVFSPLFRNHTVKESRRQEPWEFGPKVLDILKQALHLRSRLMVYSWSEFKKAAKEKRPFILPLGWFHDEEQAWQVEDQYYYGRNLMFAPILQAGALGRVVYLPGSGQWLLWRFCGLEDIKLEQVEAGLHYFECPLESMLIFIPPEGVVVLNERARNSQEIDGKSFDIIANLSGQYEDEICVDSSTTHSIGRTTNEAGDWHWFARGSQEAQWRLVREEQSFVSEVLASEIEETTIDPDSIKS